MWWNQNVWQADCKENLLLPQIPTHHYLPDLYTPSQKAAVTQGSQAATGAAGAAGYRSLPREMISIPSLLGSQHKTQVMPGWRLPRGEYLPLCPSGWQTAVNPNYDLSQSWTNDKLAGVIYQKITKWIDFMDLKLLNLTTHTEAYSAWNPHERNPYERGECKTGTSWLTVGYGCVYIQALPSTNFPSLCLQHELHLPEY